jgi:hypothetical protein
MLARRFMAIERRENLLMDDVAFTGKVTGHPAIKALISLLFQ